MNPKRRLLLGLLLPCLLAAGFVVFTAYASAATYYVDNTITDAYVASSTPDCTTYNPTTFACGSGTASAYATVADINAGHFQPGDQILLRRGEVFREQLTVPSSGTAGRTIVLGAFGSGADPLLNGSSLLSNASFSPYPLASSTLYSITPNNNLATGGTRNYRQVFSASANSNTVKIKLTAASTASWVIAGASIGPESSGNAATSLTRITFGGSNGVTIATGTSVTSDAITFPVTAGANYLVHVYMTQRNMSDAASSVYTVWYDSNAADETLVSTPSGSQLNTTNTQAFVTAVYGDTQMIWSTSVLPTFSVSLITESGTTAIVTTPIANELIPGQYVTIAGASPAGYDGTYFIIGVNSPTTFEYTTSAGLGSPATGTITYSMVAPMQVWENNTFLSKQTSLAAVAAPGSWYWNGTNLYVNGWHEDNPATNGRTYEVAHLAYGIFDNSNSYLEIKNIDSTETYGASDANGNTTYAGMSGIYLQGSNNVIHDLSSSNTWRHNFCFYTGSTNNLAYNLTLHDDFYTTDVCIYGTGTTGNTLENSSIYISATTTPVNYNGLLVFHGTASNNTVQDNDFTTQIAMQSSFVSTYDAGRTAMSFALTIFTVRLGRQ